MKILSKNNLYIIFQIITVILALLIGNVISYLNISMYLTVFLLVILYSNNKDYKEDKITSIFSCIFSLFFTFGNIKALETSSLPFIVYCLISFVGYYYLIKNILLFIYEKTKNIEITDNKKKGISKRKFIFITTIIGFILYVPYLLNYYPGITSFDTYTQLNQILGNTPYTNHHPIVHTFIIKIFYDFGYMVSKNENVGILFFTVFQMLFVSFTFSNVLYICYKNKVNKIVFTILFIFYFLVPYNCVYSVTTYKDVLFSCMMLLFILFLYENKKELPILKKIELIILSIFVCLLRTNGILVIILLLILLMKNIKKYKNIIICLSISLIFSILFNLLINIEKVKSVEAFAIPIQNISYVIKNDENISNEELNKLNKFVDTQKVKEVYDVDFVDPVKNIMDSEYLNNNKQEFIKLWFIIGKKNINMYIKSYVYQTSGYWYHNYGVNTFATFDNYDNLNIVHKNYNFKVISNLLDILMYLNRAVQHCLWSNALSIYMILYSLYYLIRNKKETIYIYPVIFLWLTLLMATPVGYEFRYQYSVFISFPFILYTLFLKKGVDNYEKNY